jgi:hypothetical protein
VRQRRWGHGSRVRGSEEEGGDDGGVGTGMRAAAGGGGGPGGARTGRALACSGCIYILRLGAF